MEFIKANKNRLIIGVIIVLIVGGLGWFMFRPDVPNVAGGADAVRADIQTAGQHNESAISELARAEQATRSLQESNAKLADTSARLAEAQRRLEITSNELSEANERLNNLSIEIKRGIDSNSELAKQGERITHQIRARRESGNIQN